MFVILILVIIATNVQYIDAEYGNLESNEDRFMLNAVIRQMFEMFRNVIRNGSEEKGVPILDPYELDYSNFDKSGEIINATFNISQGICYGLGDYQLGSFTFIKSELSLELNIHFPVISFLSEYYELKGALFQVFPLSGRGKIIIEVQNMLVKGKIYFKQSDDGSSILLNRLEDLQFTIEDIKSRTEFDNKIDVVINAMIEDLLARYLTRFSKLICARYGEYMMHGLNSILDKFESWNIIDVILKN